MRPKARVFMQENIVFEKYKNRKRLNGKAIFSKEMFAPKQRLTFFDFNYKDKYKQFLCETLYLNKEVLNHILAGLIVGFGPNNIKEICRSVKKILKELKRKYIFIEAGNKTFIQCISYHTGQYCRTYSDAFIILKNIMLDMDSIVIFSELSKCKTKINKDALMRDIIKLGDSEKGPVPDLIFIDYAKFYHKLDSDLRPYLRCIGQ
jgi:hypothetical protein